MITVINFTAESQRSAIDESMTLLARVLANLRSFDTCITTMTQSSVIVANKAGISQFLRAQLATEAFRMPAGLHGFNDSTDDDVATLVAKWCIKNPKVLFAVLATLKFIEDSVLESAEALGAPKKVSLKFKLIYRRSMSTYTKH